MSNQLNLRPDRDLHRAFAGATRFSDGHGPYFAELPNVSFEEIVDGSNVSFEETILVLDEQNGSPVVTVNLMSESGFAAVASKSLIGKTREQAREWAQRVILATDTANDLALLGFDIEVC